MSPDLVQADAWGGPHLAHQFCHIDARGAGIRGADPETPVVRDHLGEDIQDGLCEKQG